MDRISAFGYQIISGSRRTFRNKNLGLGVSGTTFDELWFAGVQESILAPIEAVGIVPADVTLGAADTQLLTAIRIIASANVGATVTTNATLSAGAAGLIPVDATGGNITIALPAAAAANGQPFAFRLARLDATANTVTVVYHAGDTTLPGGGSSAVLPPASMLILDGDGSSHWYPRHSDGVLGPTYIVASTTYTFASANNLIECWGGGSGGCGGLGGSGGAGGYTAKLVVGQAVGSTVTCTVGSGGAGCLYGSGPSGAGGTTSFGAFCSATGGGGANSNPGAGGSGVGGDLNASGQNGIDLDGSVTIAQGGVPPGWLGYGAGGFANGSVGSNGQGGLIRITPR